MTKMITNKKLSLVGDDNNNKLSMPGTLGEDNNKQWWDCWTKGKKSSIAKEYRWMKCKWQVFSVFPDHSFLSFLLYFF